MSKSKKRVTIIAVIILIAFLSVCVVAWVINYQEQKNPNATKIPILTYHRIVPDNVKEESFRDDKWTSSLGLFEKEMEYLHDSGYTTISAEEFENWYDGKAEFPKKTVMLTFDDGDYEIYYLVLPILQKYGFKATSFLIGSDVTVKTPAYDENARCNIGSDLIQKVREEYPALDFQSHSYDLHRRDGLFGIVYGMSHARLMSDFKANEKFGFSYIAYPYGDYAVNIIDAAKEAGIHMGFAFKVSQNATRTDNRFEIPRVKITGDMAFEDFLDRLK